MSPDSPHARLLRLATLASLGVAVTLVIGKAIAWWLSGSVSLLAGLTDSLLDSAASLLNLLAVHYSLRPADDDHRYGHGKAEALAGLGIALYILWSALQIARESVSILMDRELPTDISERMRELACSVPGVLGAHDVRTRISGNHWFVQLHLELPGELSLSVAHALTDRAVLAIKREYPKAEVLIHADPQEVVGKETVS
ncbi:cation transporter dimerization domain-containing protein [Pseudomonas aeruginosa]